MYQLAHKYTLQLQNSSIQVRISEHFELHRYQWVAPRHCNAEYELHIMLKGQIPINIENEHLVLAAPYGVLIPPGQYHAPLETSDKLEHFTISFSFLNGELADILREKLSNFILFEVSSDMLQECLAIYREHKGFSVYCNEKIQAFLTSLMISLLRTLNLTPTPAMPLTTTQIERADIIDDFFSEHLNDNQSSKQLASQLYLSERHLNRVLYQLYGMSFQEKMTQTRMDRAAYLLKSTNQKIVEIAEIVGYSSESAFHQAFRNYFKITPRKYREQSK